MGQRLVAAVFAALISFSCALQSGQAFAAPPVETFGKLPGIELVRLSPSGNRYAFVGALGETRRIVVASVDGTLLFNSAVGESKVRTVE
jgi:hypothetical protein